MYDSTYCYPNSNVLVNKLHIQDEAKLAQMDRRLTMLRLLDLIETPLLGDFDLAHLQAIHRYLFQDLYPWAGEIRTVEIAKGNMFCKAEFIPSQAEVIFSALAEDLKPGQINSSNIAVKLAYHFSEINALHPFRDGNGRCQREFIRTLALHFGYRLEFRRVTPEEMLMASKWSFLCDYHPMIEIFETCLVKMVQH